MQRSFRGESTNKVDAKGRVSIPAAFRRVLEAGDPDWPGETRGDGPAPGPALVVVYGDERRDFLECYTIETIAEVDAKIRRYPRASPRRRALQRLYNGQSTPMTVDETGRIVLSPKLRAKIGLAGEAFFVGNGDTFEIWHPETYDAQMGLVLAEDEGFDPAVDPAVYLDGEDEPGAPR